MADLKIHLLGAPLIEVDGRPAAFDTRKAIALLAFLVVTRESHTRDALATMLWPELDQTRARAALRRTLSSLKSAIGDAPLEIDREILAMEDIAGLWLDIDVFESYLAETQTHGHSPEEVCLRCINPLTAALATYRGDFLTGFTLRDSPNFDDWQFFKTEELRRKYAGVLERLVYIHAAQEEFQQAIEVAHRWLALDQLHEPAHRQLMKLYALAGSRNAALRQYRECVRILSQELEVAPLEETVELYETIRDNRFLVDGTSLGQSVVFNAARMSPSPVPSPVVAAYALVGRSRELATLTQAYDSVGESGLFVVIEGEAGIGKTRLAEEFLARARAGGAVTIKARCYEGESDLSYGPFVEGLRSALRGSGPTSWLEDLSPNLLAEVARLLPEVTDRQPDIPEIPPLEGLGAQSRFFEAMAQFILKLSEGPFPGVLFLDDLHWADSASWDLLTYLVRRAQRHPLLILATWRSEEISAGHRLDRLLADAQRSGIATLITLPRLDPAHVRELLETIPDQLFPPALHDRLYQETEGLPFFVVEYLSAILKAGPPAEEGRWTLPGSVRDLLYSRLRDVTETGWQVLTASAVIGRSFDFDTLRSVSGRTEEEAITALEGLIAAGLVHEVKEPEEGPDLIYDFSHEKLRGLVYEEASLARRRLLHRRLAENLESRARIMREPGQLAGQIAHHYQLAGEDESAARYHKLAGEQASRLFANEDALRHFQTALALGHPEAGRLHESIGDLQTILGDYDAALGSYETAAALGEPAGLSAIEHKLGRVHHRLGEWGSAESHFQAALDASELSGSPHQRSLIYADWSLTAHNSGQPDKARQLGRKALNLAETIGDKRAFAQAYNILGILARGRGDLARAREHLQKSLDLAQALEDPWLHVAALNNLALLFNQDGDLEAAISLLKTALSLCTSLGDRHRAAALHSNLADLYHVRGMAEESMSQLKQSVEIYAEIGEQAGAWQPEVWKLVEW